MKGYGAFVKKEWMEQVRTYRMLIMLLVFFLFGLMSPLLAKLLPELLKSMTLEGMSITLAEPTAMDSYSQFFKNNTQMGLLVLVLLFSGSLATEFSKGTLVPLLTKGLSRSSVILAKYTVSVLLWSAAVLVSFGTTYGYTAYLFPGQEMNSLGLAVLGLWAFGCFLLAALLLGGSLLKSTYGNLLFLLAIIVILFLINLFPAISPYNPLILVTENVNLLAGGADSSIMNWPLGISLTATGFALGGSLAIFKKSTL